MDVTEFGPGWNCNCLSFVEDSADDYRRYGLFEQISLHLPGGGVLVFNSGNGYRDTMAYDYYTNSRLTQQKDGQGNLTGYRLDLPDGRSYIYTVGWNYGSYQLPKYFYLSQSLDEQGFATYYNYQTVYDQYQNPIGLQLSTISDVTSTTIFTFQYNGGITGHPNLVSAVTDRFNHSAQFSYALDSNSNLHLTQITDAAGLTSTLAYDLISGFPTTLTTPYGTTSFFYIPDPDNRLIHITEPNGGQQMFLFAGEAWWTLPTLQVPPNLPANNTMETDIGWLNSFHWNQNQLANAQHNLSFPTSPSSIVIPDSFTDGVLTLARMRHWLGTSPYSSEPAGVDFALSQERAPSQDASGTTWGQITWYDYTGKGIDNKVMGTQIMPYLVAQQLPDGSTWYDSFGQNSWGLITTRTNTYGTGSPASLRTFTYSYDPNNGIDLLSVAITAPQSHTLASYTYNGRHEVLADVQYATDSTSFTTTTTYDTQGRVSTRTTAAGLLSTYTYGSGNYLANVVDSIDGTPLRTNTFTWTSGYVQTQMDPRGLTRTFTRDGLNRLTQVQYSDDNSTKQYSYSLASGQGFNNSGSAINILDVTAVKDRLGNWTYYGRDRLRRVVTVTDPLSHVTHYDYCACGGVDSITDALGTNATLYGYNNAGWRISVTHPDGHGEQYAYDALGRVITRTDSLGSRSYSYNNQGLLASVTSSYGTEKAVTYDVYDRPQTVTDANGVSVINGYDLLGRVLTRTYPDSGVEYLGYAYDFRSPAGYTNQIGDIVLAAYDAAGRKTNEIHVGVDTKRFAYSPGSDLLTLTDGKGQVTTWTYDLEGRMGGKYDASGRLILGYWYDADSRLTTRWSKAKNYTTYQYDNAGNLLYVNYPASPQLGFTYDADNRLTQMVDGVGTTVYGYSYDRLGSEDGPWATNTVSFTYNNAQLRSGLTLQPAGSWSQSYSYDAADRLSSLTSPPGNFSYTYRGPGTVWTNLALPNTAVITNAFDSVARLTQTTLRTSGGTVLNRHSYQVNQANERWQMGRTDGSTVNYNYNRAQELVKALGNGGSSTENLGYGYDAAWNLNLRTNSGVVKTFTVNNINELTGDGTYTYGYDGNGNRVGRSDGLAYVYDDENQLVNVSSSASWQSTFGYDGLGRMRVRREYNWITSGGVVAPAPVVTAATPGSPLRNDFSGWVGMRFQVGSSPVVVTELGRWVVSGNSQTHTMKLVQANGTDLAGGTTVVNTSGATAGQFVYASLAAPVTLSANTTYYVVSQEASGGDQWYNYPNGTMVFNSLASGTGAAWAYNNSTTYYVGPNLPQSYVPVNFKGTTSSVAPLASVGTITSSLRNDYSGWVGFQFEVGSTPITVTSLGRWVVSGNSASHAVKLVNADGTDVSNGSATVRTAGMTAGRFAYAPLAAPVTLSAYTTYFVVSQEAVGGDQWYDCANTPITLTGAGGALAISAPNGSTAYTLASNGSGRTFGPVNLEFASGQTGGSWALAQEVRYLYDGRRVIQERDGSNTPTVSYTRGKDLSGSMEGAGGIGGLLARSSGYSTGTGGWGTHHYYHADGNGNITYLVDAGQGLAASYEYDPYGNLLSSSGTLASANLYRFSGKEFHASSGLYYYGYRFYDPNLQRWPNRDPLSAAAPGKRAINLEIEANPWFSTNSPIELILGPNLYAFDRNSPVYFIDSFGLWYISISVSGGYWGGASGTFYFGSGGVHYSLMGGFTTPGVTGAVRWSPGNPCPRFSWALEGTAGISAAYGSNNPGWEIGGGWPPGASLMAGWTW
jgi:RHS repeat-associated protein